MKQNKAKCQKPKQNDVKIKVFINEQTNENVLFIFHTK